MKRIVLIFLFTFILCNLSYAGAINSAHDANCCSVWVTDKNPTWLFSFEKTKGGVVRTVRQPYDGSNITSTHTEGGLGVIQIAQIGVGYFDNVHDATGNIAVVESTSTRFRIYIEADLKNVAGGDSGDVQDTITIYYNRMVYDRRHKMTLESEAIGYAYRPMVWAFLATGIEDTIVFADDNEIDIVANITHTGRKDLPTSQDTVHAQQLFMTDTDTSMIAIFYRALFPDPINSYISHDEATRRGGGMGASASISRSGCVWWEGKFVYWWGTFSHDGANLQDYFVDYMYPSPITMTYGTGGTWVETRGCYQVIDGGVDSVVFTFDRDSWADSTVYNPVIEVANWDGFIPDTISVGGVKKIKDTDFYADTVDALNFLIVHYLGDISGSDTEIIIPIRAGEAPPEGANKLLLKRQQRK